MAEAGTMLPETIIQKIEAEAGKYPTRRAAVKSALRYAQAEFGWISEDVVKAVAEVLGLERICAALMESWSRYVRTWGLKRERQRQMVGSRCLPLSASVHAAGRP